VESHMLDSGRNRYGVRSAGFLWHDVFFGVVDRRQHDRGSVVRGVLKDLMKIYSTAYEYEKEARCNTAN